VGVVKKCRVAADHAGLFQPVNAALYSRCRQPDHSPDIAKGPTGVLLEQPEDLFVSRIYVVHCDRHGNIVAV
jgi:hypothetical protein